LQEKKREERGGLGLEEGVGRKCCTSSGKGDKRGETSKLPYGYFTREEVGEGQANFHTLQRGSEHKKGIAGLNKGKQVAGRAEWGKRKARAC